jgi:hypothetical protein
MSDHIWNALSEEERDEIRLAYAVMDERAADLFAEDIYRRAAERLDNLETHEC